MKTRYHGLFLLSTAIAIGATPAQTPPVEYVGTTADSDIKQVAILAIDQNHTGRKTFLCHIRNAFENKQKLLLNINGQSKVAVVAPGTYEFLARFEDNGHEGFDMSQFEFEGGKRYSIACVRKRYKNINIEVKEIPPPSPDDRSSAP